MDKVDVYIDNIFENVKFDNDQKEVIKDNSQNLMVVAGAGCGKTTTISAKVKYLVDIVGIKPEEILMLSLTNKAVTELKENINIKLGLDANICTFHKLAYDLLKKEKLNLKILSRQDSVVYKFVKKERLTSEVIKILKKDRVFYEQEKRSLDVYTNLSYFVCSIINLIRVNGYDIDKIYLDNKNDNRVLEYIKIINDKYKAYKKENNYLDFEDLIIEASKLKAVPKYKYIFVDEYQDISMNRFFLLNKLIKLTKAKCVVVGDDYQSIFAFSGAKVDLFLKFKDMMNAKILKIVKTYRNSQNLINLAGNFININPGQIKKSLMSDKILVKPVVVYGYRDNIIDVFEEILDRISSEGKKKIVVLGRYNSDIKKLECRDLIIKNSRIIYRKNKKLEIDFLTIHASKGLGFEEVVLLNFENANLGFPSKVENISIIDKIFGYDKISLLEEERRLFYVALTRTKNRVHIITKIGSESDFLDDIVNDEEVEIKYKYRKKVHKKSWTRPTLLTRIKKYHHNS